MQGTGDSAVNSRIDLGKRKTKTGKYPFVLLFFLLSSISQYPISSTTLFSKGLFVSVGIQEEPGMEPVHHYFSLLRTLTRDSFQPSLSEKTLLSLLTCSLHLSRLSVFRGLLRQLTHSLTRLFDVSDQQQPTAYFCNGPKLTHGARWVVAIHAYSRLRYDWSFLQIQ